MENKANKVDAASKPKPLYPPLLSKPQNLEQNEKIAYLVNIKQTLRNSMKDSIFYVPSKNVEKANFNSQIERYSDKYSKQKTSAKNEWQTDWSVLPKELKYHYLKDNVKRVGNKKSKNPSKAKATKPNLNKKKDYESELVLDFKVEFEEETVLNEGDDDANEAGGAAVEVTKKSEKEEDGEKKSEKENDSENDELNEEDEEDLEEDNDYIDTYFDNGENYDDDDGGDDDGGTY